MKKVKLSAVVIFINVIGFVQGAIAQAVDRNVRPSSAIIVPEGYLSKGDSKIPGAIYYDDVEGSPYLYDNWLPGDVKLAGGKTFYNIFLRYDEIYDILMFKNSMTDSALVFINPVIEFKLNDGANSMKFLSGFEPLDGTAPNAFYELLSDGDLQLLKKTTKKIVKIPKGITGTEIQRKIEASITYYLAKDKKITKINNTNKAVVAASGDKGQKVKQFIDDNKLNMKNDADLSKAIDYYNSL